MIVCRITQTGICADTITRKEFIVKLRHQLGDRLDPFEIGCASLLCVRDHLSDHLQLVKADDIETTIMGKIILDGQVSEY